MFPSPSDGDTSLWSSVRGDVADHEHGTRRVRRDVLADRPEQHPGEPTVPAAADHEQVGAACRVDQHLRRVSLHGLAGHRISLGPEGLMHGIIKYRLRIGRPVGRGGDGVTAGHHRVLPGDHRLDRGPSQRGLPSCSLQCVDRGRRAIDSDHNAFLRQRHLAAPLVDQWYRWMRERVLLGRRVTKSWDGAAGRQMIVPDGRHTLLFDSPQIERCPSALRRWRRTYCRIPPCWK